MRDEQIEILPLAIRPAHRVAHEDPVAVIRQGILDLGRHLPEEGQGHGRHDDTDRVGGLAVQRSRDLIGPVVELGDRLGDAVLRLLAEVTAVVEHARDRCQGDACDLGDFSEGPLIIISSVYQSKHYPSPCRGGIT